MLSWSIFGPHKKKRRSSSNPPFPRKKKAASRFRRSSSNPPFPRKIGAACRPVATRHPLFTLTPLLNRSLVQELRRLRNGYHPDLANFGPHKKKVMPGICRPKDRELCSNDRGQLALCQTICEPNLSLNSLHSQAYPHLRTRPSLAHTIMLLGLGIIQTP